MEQARKKLRPLRLEDIHNYEIQRNSLIDKLRLSEQKNINPYAYRVLRALENETSPFYLLEILITDNMQMFEKYKEAVTLSPPPKYIICKNQEHYESIINNLKK